MISNKTFYLKHTRTHTHAHTHTHTNDKKEKNCLLLSLYLQLKMSPRGQERKILLQNTVIFPQHISLKHSQIRTALADKQLISYNYAVNRMSVPLKKCNP